MGKRLTKEEFVEKSIKAHGNKYDYSLVDYKNNSTKVIIVCPMHGKFEQNPAHHMNGCECFKCSYLERNNDKLKGKDFYMNKLKEKYGENYIFEFEYPFKKSIKVFCKIHGWSEKNIQNLLNGNICACSFCSGKRSKEIDFIKEMNVKYNNKYDYSKIDFSDKKHLKIICPKHGEFIQSFIEHKHMKGDACPKCHIPLIYTQEVFLDLCYKKYGYLYDYSLVKYERSNKNVKIICKKHGIFEKTPNKFLRGQGCQKCSGSMSHSESIVEKALVDLKQHYKKQFWFKDCKHISYLKFDFAIFADVDKTNLKYLIEYDGEQHYGIFEFHKGDFEKTQRRDKIKTDYCLKNNIKLIRIPYWEKDNIEKILTEELTIK